MMTATHTASRRPLTNIAPSAAISASVTAMRCAVHRRANGFSMMCAVASAADSVMVMTKAGGGKPEEAQDQRLAPPARQLLLEHRDAALPVRAELGNARVCRQRAKQRHQDQDERRNRRKEPGGEERDARLIAERRKIIDAREAHDLPPGRGVQRLVGGRRIFHAVIEPRQNRPARALSRSHAVRSGPYACATSSVSRLILISSPTATPPVSSTWFHVRPNSLRLIFVARFETRALSAPGSSATPVRRHVKHDLAADVADCQVANHLT